MSDYITIAEYAKIRGCSKQAVYSRLNNALKDFVQEVDGKKVLSVKALTAEELTKLEQGLNQGHSTNTNDTTQQIIDLLREELKAKDQQIADLAATVTKLTDSLTAAQALHAATAQQLQLLTSPGTNGSAEQEENTDNASENPEASETAGTAPSTADTVEPDVAPQKANKEATASNETDQPAVPEERKKIRLREALSLWWNSRNA